MFDGESLTGWEIVDFVGAGPVEVRDGAIILGAGDPMTGINWVEDFPTMDYELTLEAKKVSGNDFFAAITFPVGEDPCTLVIGGWGGGVVGLSSIDGDDALRNATTRWMSFEYDRWYAIRLRVTREEIQAWIDEVPVVDFAYRGHELSVRVEVIPNIPIGISTWYTTGALRNIRVRELEASP